jgi:RHS repeat-associated protein
MTYGTLARRVTRGFEPFGRDWQEGTSQDASAKGILLRLPGQWDDPLWDSATLGENLYYNLHRWYETQSGRYTSVDPLVMAYKENGSVFSYAASNPLLEIDSLGLCEFKPCSDLTEPPKPCDCDKNRTKAAAEGESGLAKLFCKYRNSNTCPPGMGCGQALPKPCDPRVLGKLDENGKPVYKPQGDPCLEWCTCQHEKQHARDLDDPQVQAVFGPMAEQQAINWLECRAYTAGSDCLSGLVSSHGGGR